MIVKFYFDELQVHDKIPTNWEFIAIGILQL